jgi:hypothetical protein
MALVAEHHRSHFAAQRLIDGYVKRSKLFMDIITDECTKTVEPLS